MSLSWAQSSGEHLFDLTVGLQQAHGLQHEGEVAGLVLVASIQCLCARVVTTIGLVTHGILLLLFFAELLRL